MTEIVLSHHHLDHVVDVALLPVVPVHDVPSVVEGDLFLARHGGGAYAAGADARRSTTDDDRRRGRMTPDTASTAAPADTADTAGTADTAQPAAALLRHCPCCGRSVDRFLPGPGGRPDAQCPTCYSLERQRFLAVLLDGLLPFLVSARNVLDIAPSRQSTGQLYQLVRGRYVRMDFDPSADARAVDVQASMTDMPFPDGSFDLVLCYHVLEHVPDDASAMRELRRVLAPGGIALVQFPWRAHAAVTDEDPSAPVEERVRRFGQADHVRYYGRDVEDRLHAAGLAFVRVTPLDLVGPGLVERWRLAPDEAVWMVRGDGGRLPEPRRGSGRLSAGTLLALGEQAGGSEAELARLRALVARLREEGREARAAARRWERAYRNLVDRPPVKALRAVVHGVRGVAARRRG